MTPQKTKTTTVSIALFKQTLEGNNYSPQSIKAYMGDLGQFVESPVLPWPAPSPLWVACGADSARPAWRATALSPAAGVRGWLGREPSGDTGEVRGGTGGWARVKSGFIFPILHPLVALALLAAKSSEAMIYLSMTRLILCRLAAA
jgi:hypothetical protein